MRLGRLRASLAPAREHLAAEAHRVQRIENNLADVEARIQELQSFTLQNILDSLMWKKEGKLNALREELSKLEPDCEAGERELLELDASVRRIESEVTVLSNAEEVYKNLCDRKNDQILAAGGESAERLQDVTSRLNAAKSERQTLRKCLHVGRNLIERLQSMSKALGRAKNKMMHGGPLGALGNLAVKAVHKQTADPVVRRAREGLGEFARSLESLKHDPTCERDGELVRLGAVLGQSQGDLDKENGIPSLMEVIHQAIGLLGTKLDEVEPTVASLEARRIELIEMASVSA